MLRLKERKCFENLLVNLLEVCPSLIYLVMHFVVNTEHFVRFNICKASKLFATTSQLVVGHNHMMHCVVVCLLQCCWVFNLQLKNISEHFFTSFDRAYLVIEIYVK